MYFYYKKYKLINMNELRIISIFKIEINSFIIVIIIK